MNSRTRKRTRNRKKNWIAGVYITSGTCLLLACVGLAYFTLSRLGEAAIEQGRLEKLAESQRLFQRRLLKAEVDSVTTEVEKLEETLGPRKDWIKLGHVRPEVILSDLKYRLDDSRQNLASLLRYVVAGQDVLSSASNKQVTQSELRRKMADFLIKNKQDVDINVAYRLHGLDNSLGAIRSVRTSEDLDKLTTEELFRSLLRENPDADPSQSVSSLIANDD